VRASRTLRKRIFEIIEPAQNDDVKNDVKSRIFDIFILSLIFLNVFTAIISTVSTIDSTYGHSLYMFEIFSIIIFTTEYLLRIWTCVEIEKFSKPFSGRISYIFTPMALVDILAILPFYFSMLGVDLRMVRVLRLFRLFRVAKAGRYFKAFDMIKNVFKSRKEELSISIVMIAMILVLASSVMYYLESPVQPEAFSSIPASMWWAIATLTTVGYGDVYPITPMGKLMGAIIAVAGVGLFALPAGIIASGFMEQIEKKNCVPQSRTEYCCHCGRKIDS